MIPRDDQTDSRGKAEVGAFLVWPDITMEPCGPNDQVDMDADEGYGPGPASDPM